MNALAQARLAKRLDPGSSFLQSMEALGSQLSRLDIVPGELSGSGGALGLQSTATRPVEVADTCRWHSWAEPGVGLFLMDVDLAGELNMEGRCVQEVLIFGVVIDFQKPRSYYIDRQMVGIDDISTEIGVFQEPDYRICISAPAGKLLRSAVVAVTREALTKRLGLPFGELPATVRQLFAQQRNGFARFGSCLPAQQIARQLYAHECSSAELSALYLRAKTYELIFTLFSAMSRADAEPDDPPVTRRDLHRIAEIRRLLERNLTLAATVENLARMAGMNRTKLRYLFKSAYGVTISEFRTALVMNKADDLLRTTDMPASVIAHQLGYNSSSFSVAYKKFFGHCLSTARVLTRETNSTAAR